MKFFGVVAVLVAGSGAWARHVGQTPKRVVTVCLSSGGNATVLDFGRARATAILKQAGIQLEWRLDERSCIAAGNGFVVTVSRDTPRDRNPGALAYALPFERSHIVLFYDRVLNTASRSIVPYLLGYVLAHEIAHMLQAFERHSESGIMKAHWDIRDFAKMRRGSLHFTEEDIVLIHRGIDRRASRPAAPAK